MNNEEKEKHLRELLQAALDGKQLQMFIDAAWRDLGANNALTFNIELFGRLGLPRFRIKPEPKVFKYQTRPYYKCDPKAGGGFGYGVWNSHSTVNQQVYEAMHSDENFKWLAPATDHEAIINE
jgi:hypothetical protein